MREFKDQESADFEYPMRPAAQEADGGYGYFGEAFLDELFV
jgi:hypothetical protein